MPLLLLLLLQEPQSPEETLRRLRLPDGFEARLFAAEPDIVQPVSFAIDDRGRLWVAEMRSYPKWDARDRIVILEDADGDGRAEKRTVFFEGLTYVTGIEIGFGGLWVIAPPKMLFIPDRNRDDSPDGPPEVLLDGFGLHGGHNIANGFTWGPDGWLYAGHGRTSISEIGKPGAPLSERVHFDGGVWRYHPTRHVFEPWADGTTNPWGVAFDDYGQLFVSNCVDPHLFHAVQGAHFEPWRGRESSRFAYRRIDTIADHVHWAAGNRVPDAARRDQVLAAGGGHAHCGTMVYLGDSFPAAYRGSVFMSNLHGHRINNDLLMRKGSGYTASHGPDFILSSDPMFLGLSLQVGPDGSVFVSDWYDRGECHTRKPHDSSGRIYKIVYKGTPAVRVDLAKLSDEELVRLQLHPNDWHVAHARRILQERGSINTVHQALAKLLDNPDVTRKLRALWALHVTGGRTQADWVDAMTHREEYVRAWAIQLEMEDRTAEAPGLLQKLAVEDPSPVVRLYLAAACRRLPLEVRWPILRRLAARAEDVADPNLPLMIWYAAEPAIAADPARGLELIKSTSIPLLREFAARRLASFTPLRRARKAIEDLAGTIAFSSLAPRGWDLHHLDRETGKTAKLAEHAALDYNAALSPDGRQVAFVSERDGNPEIRVVSIDGSSLRRLTDEFALDDHPTWSPDGRSILFSSTREISSTPGRAWNALYVMAADGTGVQRLSPADAADLSPAWSPWGDAIAFVSGGDLYAMRPDGSDRRLVIEDGGWPAFAPRSRSTVYFHSRRDGTWGIWRVNLDGSGLKRISPPDVEAFTPSVAGSAPLLVAVVKRGQIRKIELMDLDTFKLTPLPQGPGDPWNPSISSDGRHVVYHKAAAEPASEVESWGVPPESRLALRRVRGFFPVFSPDGTELALAGEGFDSLDVMKTDGSGRRILHKGAVFGLSWARAGDLIAFSGGGDADVAVVSPDGTGFRKLTEKSGFPSFSPDGRQLVFRDGSKNLHVMDRNGSSVRRLTEGRWTDTMADWSPTGDAIAFASDRGGDSGIWLVNPDGSGLRKLVGGGGRNTHPRFSPDGKWIVFASERAGSSAEEISLPHQPQPCGELFAVRLDGSGLLRLTHNGFEEGTPSWGPALR